MRVAALAALAIAPPPVAHAARILAVQSSDAPRLVRALSALRERAGIPVDVVRLSEVREDALESTLGKADRQTIVVALGPRASDFLVQLPSPVPVVHCLAGAEAMRAGLPAIPSEVPAEQHAAWLRQLVPAARTVGLAYDPATNTRHAEAAAASLSVAGYRTLLAPVSTPSALPAALEQLAARRVDVLLALPDGTVYTRESARGILLHSFRKRMPVIGPNDAWVRMGALYALDWNYDEVGATCAQLALRVLLAAKVPEALPSPPRPRVSVNLKAAAQFGLQWDPGLLRTVDIRHE